MPFNPDYFSVWDAKSVEDRVMLAGIFLDAHSDSDYRALLDEYPRIFGYRSQGQTLEDIKSVCEVMRKATIMYALRNVESPSIDEMLMCGISPCWSGWGDADTPAEEIEMTSFSTDYEQYVKGRYYQEWMQDAVKRVTDRFNVRSYSMQYRNGLLFYSSGMRPVEDWAKASDDCAQILQLLITLHLADITTVCDGETLSPIHVSYSGISLLWFGLVERLCSGRAYRCEACGKPGIAIGERRRKKFCSDACRKWASSHKKGEKRGHWYMER